MLLAKQKFPIMGFITICFLTASISLPATIINNTKCPVEPTELAVSKYKSNYKGKTIYFCCKDCVSIFNNNPKPYLKTISEFTNIKSSKTNKTALQNIFDHAWNTAFSFPGISVLFTSYIVILLMRVALLKFPKTSFISTFARTLSSSRSIQLLTLCCLTAEVLHAHLSYSIASKDIELENKLHSTTFLEYGEPLIPSRPKRDPSLQSKFYRGNDERNPNLYNGGNYRTAEFHIDLCNNEGRSVNYDSRVSADNLFIRVAINRSPNTAEYFWKKDRMNGIYVTKNSGKFHWTKDKITDYVQLIETENETSWEFRYPLINFHVENHIKGIIYLCEKRKSDNGDLIGGRFHYAFQFNLKINGNTLDPMSDLWMGPLYRKRSLRIWEIPENEWLSQMSIPENQSKVPIKNSTLLGTKDYEENTN
ncbi:YHS domain-containing protein [Verrucomicrobia bacterium]|nr:YHS domain-containing protein [Verrucomicrobiota bacterium]